jgi:hypothetical protein
MISLQIVPNGVCAAWQRIAADVGLLDAGWTPRVAHPTP